MTSTPGGQQAGLDAHEPLLPPEATHFFTGVAFETLPTIDYREIEELSQLAIHHGTVGEYRGARDALQKLQWARLAGAQAIALDARFVTAYQKPEVLLVNPVFQVQHAKALFEAIAHTKSALDNLAVCVSDVFKLDAGGGGRDLKWSQFRSSVGKRDAALARKLDELSKWLDNGTKTSSGIQGIRDYWIHRGAPVTVQFHPPTDRGALAVPRGIPAITNGARSSDFWRTDEFVEFHVRRAETVFSEVIQACLRLERAKGATIEIKRSKIKVGPFMPLIATQSTQMTMHLLT